MFARANQPTQFEPLSCRRESSQVHQTAQHPVLRSALPLPIAQQSWPLTDEVVVRVQRGPPPLDVAPIGDENLGMAVLYTPLCRELGIDHPIF